LKLYFILLWQDFILFYNKKNNSPRLFSFPLSAILLFSLFICVFITPISLRAEPHADAAAQGLGGHVVKKTIGGLLKKANAELGEGKLEDAADTFYEIHLDFPDSKQAEDALWRTAQLKKEISLTKRDADLEQVRDLFRRYIDYYPKSARIPEAYLELGIAYFHMRFYREALSYFKLFVKSYPASPLVFRARQWEGRTLIKIGREAEAEAIFQRMLKNKDVKIRRMGKISMGDLRYEQGRYHEATDFYQMVILEYPNYYLSQPDLLRKAGLADIKYGKVARGRQEIYHYLSLDLNVTDRPAVMAALADSYYQSGDYQTAQTLFDQVIKNGEEGSREMLFAKLRLAQYKDSSAFKMSRWDKPHDLSDPQGDKPYLAILDKYFSGPMVQDARYGLFRRYKARKDLQKANAIGSGFLRNSATYKGGLPVDKRLGNIMLYLVREFLQKKEYQKIYNLYFVDFRHEEDYPDGRLLCMVGQALQGLKFYNQAAVIYYRALRWPLSAQDKAELYFRRAQVYLQQKDYGSANRLLTYLRKIYKGTGSAGEVYFYSGKLAEAQGDKASALDFYQLAVDAPTFIKKMPEYAGEAMRLALELGKNDKAYNLWRQALQSGGMPKAAAQDWTLRIGSAFRQGHIWDKAAAVYRAGLTDGFPEKGKDAQLCNLYLGDSLFALGKKREGIAYYQKAQEGEDAMIKQLAMDRLQQNKMSTQFNEMKKVLAN